MEGKQEQRGYSSIQRRAIVSDDDVNKLGIVWRCITKLNRGHVLASIRFDVCVCGSLLFLSLHFIVPLSKDLTFHRSVLRLVF